MIPLLLLAIAIGAYAVILLQKDGQLKWMDEKHPYGFWGKKSYLRKYKLKVDMEQKDKLVVDRRMIPVIPSYNWYYGNI
jgi:hypothetical protein